MIERTEKIEMPFGPQLPRGNEITDLRNKLDPKAQGVSSEQREEAARILTMLYEHRRADAEAFGDRDDAQKAEKDLAWVESKIRPNLTETIENHKKELVDARQALEIAYAQAQQDAGIYSKDINTVVPENLKGLKTDFWAQYRAIQTIAKKFGFLGKSETELSVAEDYTLVAAKYRELANYYFDLEAHMVELSTKFNED